MTTYGDMQAQIADELTRSDLTSQIQTTIQAAITHYQRQRFWFNEGIDTASTVNGTANISVPTDYQGEDTLKLTYSGYPFPLQKITWDLMELYRVNAAQAISVPTFYAYYADNFWLYPTPNGVYTLTISYIRNLGTLAVSGDSNAWTTHAEALIRYRAKGIIRADYLYDQNAIDERRFYRESGQPFFTDGEASAFLSLQRQTVAKEATGFLRPTQF